MKAEALKPQMTQMNGDLFLNASICAHLRHLRLVKMDKAMREILEKIGYE